MAQSQLNKPIEKAPINGTVFIATGNLGKLREITPMLEEYFVLNSPVQNISPKNVVEDAPDFAGNALIKAHSVLREINAQAAKPETFWVLADDSGLSVDALNGAPGVHSARYAGDHVSSEQHMQKLIEELQPLHELAPFTAHYTCALALCSNQGQQFVALGRCYGEIVLEAKGQSGFGYDPIFYSNDVKKTFAEVSYDEKNAFSHRRRAFEELRNLLVSRAV